MSDGEYDYEDEWIDDSEFAAFVEGDRRKPKHSGFFINKVGGFELHGPQHSVKQRLICDRTVQGEIEKTDEDLPLSVWESPPKKRRKKKTGAAPEEGVATGNPDTQQENETEEPGDEQAKKKRKKMLSSNNDATKSSKKVLASYCIPRSRASLALLRSSLPPPSRCWLQMRQTTLRMMPPTAAAEPPATDAVPQPPSLAVQAAIAGVTFIDIPEGRVQSCQFLAKR